MTDTNDDMSWAIRANPCHPHSKTDNRYYVLYNHWPILKVTRPSFFFWGGGGAFGSQPSVVIARVLKKNAV